MVTCFIRHEMDPARPEAFEAYAKRRGQVIPRCGADAPHATRVGP